MNRPSRRQLATAAALCGAGACVALAILEGAPALDDGAASTVGPKPSERSVGAESVFTVADPSAPSAAEAPTWSPDEVMVRPLSDLDAIADWAGATVVEPVGRSGLGVLRAAPGQSADALLAALRAEGLVAGGSAMGVTRGAGLRAIEAVQWGHDESELPRRAPSGLASVTVAVLDTGVAYEDTVSVDGTVYKAAGSLASAPIVAPWDFVSDDAHANDDHQHGTHIASIIASDGDIEGVAPGAGLMPLKVLDADNMGSEYDLIEALYYAADNGADVVNLSLTFGQGYVPSRGLLNAIDYVADAGVVMVGASGNEGAREVSWPAASPRVIAVGSYCVERQQSYSVAPHSNIGPALDTMAPGGCMDQDVWGADGIPDGIVGETIALNQPAQPGYWVMAGTSQAAAHVSGAVANLIAAGGDPAHTALYLHDSNRPWSGHKGYPAGLASGRLQVDSLIASGLSGMVVDGRTDQRYDVSLTPFLEDNGDGTVTPKARVTVIDVDGEHARKGDVVGQLHGSTGGMVSCSLVSNVGRSCVLEGPPAPRLGADGQPSPLAWRFVVSAVVQNNDYAYRPSGLLFASDTFDQLVATLRARPDMADAVLAYHWPDGPVEGFGDLDESYVVMDSGAGISTSPFGLVLTPEAVASVGTLAPASIDGAGISTSPFGVVVIEVNEGLSGSGISTSPFGIVALEADDIFGGAGISTSPFGMTSITDPVLDACVDDCNTFWNDPIRLATSEILAPAEVDVSGTSLQAQLLDGGWTTPDGASAASTLSTQETLQLEADSDGASTVRPPQQLILSRKGR